jgi:hypothetical protein
MTKHYTQNKRRQNTTQKNKDDQTIHKKLKMNTNYTEN